MSKKADILKKADNTQYYDLTDNEILEIASLIALIEQAEAARNFMYSRIAQNIADRHKIVDKEITLNFEEIMSKGAQFAKLVVKD